MKKTASGIKGTDYCFCFGAAIKKTTSTNNAMEPSGFSAVFPLVEAWLLGLVLTSLSRSFSLSSFVVLIGLFGVEWTYEYRGEPADVQLRYHTEVLLAHLVGVILGLSLSKLLRWPRVLRFDSEKHLASFFFAVSAKTTFVAVRTAMATGGFTRYSPPFSEGVGLAIAGATGVLGLLGLSVSSWAMLKSSTQYGTWYWSIVAALILSTPVLKNMHVLVSVSSLAVVYAATFFSMKYRFRMKRDGDVDRDRFTWDGDRIVECGEIFVFLFLTHVAAFVGFKYDTTCLGAEGIGVPCGDLVENFWVTVWLAIVSVASMVAAVAWRLVRKKMVCIFCRRGRNYKKLDRKDTYRLERPDMELKRFELE